MIQYKEAINICDVLKYLFGSFILMENSFCLLGVSSTVDKKEANLLNTS